MSADDTCAAEEEEEEEEEEEKFTWNHERAGRRRNRTRSLIVQRETIKCEY